MEVVKILHILAIISWMAGLLYLPRLFVYHANEPADSNTARVFIIMERRLYYAIMTPAMIVAWLTGLYLAWFSFGFSSGWLHAKLFIVILMSVHHGFQGYWSKAFSAGFNAHTARFFRIQNEVPTLLMIFIVILVIAKPF